MNRRIFFIAATLALAVSALHVGSGVRPAFAAPLTTTDLSGALEPGDLANALAGPGVSVTNVTYMGADPAAGTFSGGSGIIGFDSGIILSSGDIAHVVGPNVQDGVTAVNNTAGDPDLDGLSGFQTYDAAVLQFDITANADEVFFEYVFASDEYNEFVNSPYNDTFAFFIGGVNCAVVPGTATPVSVNTINNGNPFGGGGPNSDLYINNDLTDGGGAVDTEMDGLTTTLVCAAPVTPNVSTHVKLAIADASDHVLDSVVLIKQGSFSTVPPGSVAIDLHPGSCPNPLKVGSFGKLPAAILGTETFDVTQIDVSTVRLEGVAPLRSGWADIATPYEPYVGRTERLDCTTAGPDGYLDLTLKFDTAQVAQALGPLSDGQVIVATLTAELLDGTVVTGEDVLWIVN